MNLEEMKKELSELKAPGFSVSTSEGKEHSMKELIRLLRKQDKEDQAYIIRRKIIPIAVGIVIFTILLIFSPIRNPAMVPGCVLISVYLGVIVVLLAVFWIIGHIRYRKRHREKHRPLLELIEELKREPAANA